MKDFWIKIKRIPKKTYKERFTEDVVTFNQSLSASKQKR